MPLGRFLKTLLSALFALAVLLILAVQFSFVQSESDVNDYAAYEQAAKNSLETAQSFIVGITEWFGHLDHDDWLAFSTVLIAIFTGSLWWSTRRLWQVTSKTVETLVATERPHLFIAVHSQNLQGKVMMEGQEVGDVEGRANTDYWVKYSFKNYGRTPAIIKEASLSLVHLVTLPEEWSYFPRDGILPETALAEGQSTLPKDCHLNPTIPFTTRDRGEIFRATRSLWFIGRVLYDDVIGSGEHDYRFVWRYNAGTHGFRPYYGNPNYIKNT